MYSRLIDNQLYTRLIEPRKLINVIIGPRQVGKTTSVLNVLKKITVPHLYVSCDDPGVHNSLWLSQQWELARHHSHTDGECILAIDEIQKITDWSEIIKRFWDEDSRLQNNVKVVLLGSSALLVHKGLSESLAGRFETIRATHWSFQEMRDAFSWTVDQYLFFGGYPGAAALIHESERWRRYVIDALIEPSIANDILLMERIRKPALLRQLFYLGCAYSAQIISYQKIVGQLQDAGNTTTLTHYLELLGRAGLVRGLEKYTKTILHTRSSSPKMQVLNNALFTVQIPGVSTFAELDPARRGRMTESAVGAHLCTQAETVSAGVLYWRERNQEVDFVVTRGDQCTAIEVKSGQRKEALPGMATFARKFSPGRTMLVGDDGIPLKEFLLMHINDLF